jgi:hypothetical protein
MQQAESMVLRVTRRFAVPSKMHPRHADLLRRFDQLSDDAVVPSQVTASILNISMRTVQRRLASVQLSPNRIGQRVGDVRAISRGVKK